MTIENQLFYWKGWDELGVNDLQFYDVVFQTKVGPYNAGDTAPCVAMLLSESKIVVYDGDSEAYVGRLVVSVEDE
jgi:hypothetical protein